MSAHTPSPWTTDEADHDAPYQSIKIKAGKHHTVCTVWIDDAPVHDFNAKQQANARLISAAPELLAALMDFSEAMRQANDTPHLIDNTHALQLAVNSARSAITNATETQL